MPELKHAQAFLRETNKHFQMTEALFNREFLDK